MVGVYIQQMVQYRAVAIAVEIKVTVVCHVYNRWGVGRCTVVHHQGVVARQPVGHTHLHRSWEVVVAVWAGQLQHQRVLTLLHYLKQAVLPTHRTSVQAVRSVVLRQLYRPASYVYSALSYPVGVASYRGSEIAKVPFSQVFLGRVKSQYHILHLALAVWNDNRDNSPAVIGHNHLHAVAVAKRICVHVICNSVYRLKEFRPAVGRHMPPSRCKNGLCLAAATAGNNSSLRSPL